MKNIADGISSPNPNYEQKVKCVTGENTVRVRGKNLLNTLNLFVYEYKGVTYTPVYENGKLLYIDVNGTATEISFMSIQILLKPNSKYYISGCPLNGSNDTYKDMMLDSIYYTSSVNDFGNGVSLSTGSKTSWQYRVRINAGYTCNHLKFYPMIEEASENQTEPSNYEPYYTPQEKELDLESENIFDRNNSTESTYLSTYTGRLSDSSVSDTSDYIPIDSKGLYLNYDFTTLLASNNRNLCYYDENKSFISGIIYNIQDKKIKVDYVQNAKYIRFTYDKNLTDIKVYKEKYELYENGYFSRENGKWFLNNELKKYTFTGKETIETVDSNRCYTLKISNYTERILIKTLESTSNLSKAYSNIFSVGTQTNSRNEINKMGFSQWNNVQYLYVNINVADSVESCKQLLSSNYIVYELETPSKTEITNQTLINQLNDIYKLMSYDGTTIIETECETGNLPILIKASALLDSAKVIEDLETRIEVLESEE